MLPFFEYTGVDKAFYLDYIAPRIPPRIFDVHVHAFLQKHVDMVPESDRKAFWASECVVILSCGDVHACGRELYHDASYAFAAFPSAIPEADTKGMNEYIAAVGRAGNYIPLMMVRPERFTDENNIRELLIACDWYPDVTIIIAHFGRSYCPWYLERGLDMMGDPSGFLFDTTAVINPAAYDIAFEQILAGIILCGSDMHVLLWHGKREWTEKSYKNFARENNTWNTDRRSPEEGGCLYPVPVRADEIHT